MTDNNDDVRMATIAYVTVGMRVTIPRAGIDYAVIIGILECGDDRRVTLIDPLTGAHLAHRPVLPVTSTVVIHEGPF